MPVGDPKAENGCQGSRTLLLFGALAISCWCPSPSAPHHSIRMCMIAETRSAQCAWPRSKLHQVSRAAQTVRLGPHPIGGDGFVEKTPATEAVARGAL
jgi:hypothetical protein